MGYRGKTYVCTATNLLMPRLDPVNLVLYLQQGPAIF